MYIMVLGVDSVGAINFFMGFGRAFKDVATVGATNFGLPHWASYTIVGTAFGFIMLILFVISASVKHACPFCKSRVYRAIYGGYVCPSCAKTFNNCDYDNIWF